jgi:hypothetical protein
MTREAGDRGGDADSAALGAFFDYNSKLIEFGLANAGAGFDAVRRIAGVKSPPEFFQVLTDVTREQFERLSEQIDELSTLTRPTKRQADDETASSFWE